MGGASARTNRVVRDFLLSGYLITSDRNFAPQQIACQVEFATQGTASAAKHSMVHPIHRVARSLKTQPRLLFAIGLTVAVVFLLPHDWVQSWVTRLLIGWNVGTCTYLFLAAHMMIGSTVESIHRRARLHAESRLVVIVLVVAAALASLVAIIAQLAVVKDLHGSARALHGALAALTLLTSWLFTHTMFALHYAHDYYEAAQRKQPVGLAFPGTEMPDYGDFLYCAFIVGTSGQTADVSFTSSSMRRIGLVHSVLSFLFNTSVLALAINLGAGFL